MLKIYGCQQCPDCVKCKNELEQAGVEFLYLNISENLLFLKQFLKLRDNLEVFTPIKERGQIGIPCILAEDGTVSFEWSQYL